MKKIIITIDEQGEATVKTAGFQGPSCKDASRFIEEALGEKTAERLTPEYHTKAKTTNRNNLNQ